MSPIKLAKSRTTIGGLIRIRFPSTTTSSADELTESSFASTELLPALDALGGDGKADLPAVVGGGGAEARVEGGGGTAGAFVGGGDTSGVTTFGLSFSASAFFASSLSFFSSSISVLLLTMGAFLEVWLFSACSGLVSTSTSTFSFSTKAENSSMMD